MFFLSNITYAQFLLAHRDSLKWIPEHFCEMRFFSKADCHRSYLEPTSLCCRAERCSFPSIRPQVGQAFSVQAKLGDSRVPGFSFVLHTPETSTILEQMNVQHSKTSCLTLSSLTFRKTPSHFYSVLKFYPCDTVGSRASWPHTVGPRPCGAQGSLATHRTQAIQLP